MNSQKGARVNCRVSTLIKAAGKDQLRNLLKIPTLEQRCCMAVLLARWT